MKKRYAILAGLCIMSMLAVGCGNKSNDAEATPTPEPTTAVSNDNNNIVEMEQSTGIDKTKITNIMGTKTDSSSELVITNKTGLEISAFYVRPSGDEQWSEDYIQNKFTLKDGAQALYYYNSMEKDDSGNTITKFDLKVSYSDKDESDCMFRNLTLTDIEELKLNMEDGVPFVTYTSLSTKREVSTLEDAKARMGRTDETTSSESDSENTDDATVTPTPDANSDTSSDSSEDSSNSGDGDDGSDGSGSSDDSGDVTDSGLRGAAEGTIGQSTDSLESACGGANSSEYSTDEDTGAQIGYYYYDGFTVSTTVQDGQEVVTGVW